MEILDQNEDFETIDDSEEVYFYKPSLVLRIKSMMIDSVVLVLLMYLASIVLNGLGIESGNIRGLMLVLIFMYEPICVTINRTIGQKVIGLRVRNFKTYVDTDKKENINIAFSFLRFVAKVSLGWISLLTIHSDNYGQAIHDKLGNSVMTVE